MTRLDVALVGGCHMDVLARSAGRFEPGTSCPGRASGQPGGVARNVAVLLASAGLGTALVGLIGDDDAGRTVRGALEAAGVEAVLQVVPDARTGTYVAVHDETGELVAAVSDLGLYDAVTPDVVFRSDHVSRARLVFADANLPAGTLRSLADRVGARLVVDAISRAKAPRLSGLVGSAALLFANLPSANALLGATFEDPSAAAAALGARGATRVVITGGALPVAVLEGDRVVSVPVPRVTVADVTGAGDALAAGTVAALARGWSLVDAVRVGVAAAAAAVATTGALAALPTAVTEAVAGSVDPPG